MVEKNDTTGPSKLFNQLDALRIIFFFNLFIPVIETRIVRRPVEELESSRVECRFFVFTSQVLDDDSVISSGIVSLPFACQWVGVDVLVCFFAVGWWDEVG